MSSAVRHTYAVPTRETLVNEIASKSDMQLLRQGKSKSERCPSIWQIEVFGYFRRPSFNKMVLKYVKMKRKSYSLENTGTLANDFSIDSTFS